jgi:hypothetical protein
MSVEKKAPLTIMVLTLWPFLILLMVDISSTTLMFTFEDAEASLPCNKP